MVAVVVLVEIERPVRPGQRLLRRRQVFAGAGGCRGAGASDAARAGGQESGERQRARAADQASPADLGSAGLGDQRANGGVFGQGSTGHGALLKRYGNIAHATTGEPILPDHSPHDDGIRGSKHKFHMNRCLLVTKTAVSVEMCLSWASPVPGSQHVPARRHRRPLEADHRTAAGGRAPLVCRDRLARSA